MLQGVFSNLFKKIELEERLRMLSTATRAHLLYEKLNWMQSPGKEVTVRITEEIQLNWMQSPGKEVTCRITEEIWKFEMVKFFIVWSPRNIQE